MNFFVACSNDFNFKGIIDEMSFRVFIRIALSEVSSAHKNCLTKGSNLSLCS